MAEFLDLAGVAEMLGVDLDAAYVLVRRGELPGIRIAVGWRVERSEVLRYKASH